MFTTWLRTKRLVPHYTWQELDKVRVQGRDQAVSIFRPICLTDQQDPALATELKLWQECLNAYRSQQWEPCERLLASLKQISAENYLYSLYQERINSMKLLPFDPDWDGSTNFEAK